MFDIEIALNQWEVFLLILVRIASFVYTAPFFNIQGIPQRTKLGLAVFMSILVFMLVPDKTLEYSGIVDYGILILKESIVGLLLGFAANVCVQTIQFAGHIIEVNIGLSMASMFDQTTQTQTGVVGQLYYYGIMLLMIISGLYQFMIKAIIDTYSIIPIGQATVNILLYDSFLEVIAEYFLIGFRIAMPVFVAVMIMNVILGILTRVAPQFNMFAIGIQIKLLAGLAIMFLTIGLLPTVSSFLMDMIENVIVNIAGGLL